MRRVLRENGRTCGLMRLLIALLILLVATACDSSGRDSTHRDKRLSGQSNAQIAREVDAASSHFPEPPDSVRGARQLQFTQAGVKERLTAVGLNPVDAGVVRQQFLGPVGRTYRITGGEIQAYIYGDANALARDADKLDTVRVAPPTMMVKWTMPPTLIVANNLAAILLTRDKELRVRLRNALKQY